MLTYMWPPYEFRNGLAGIPPTVLRKVMETRIV